MTNSKFEPAPETRDRHADHLLTPKNSLLTLMDYQPEIIAPVESIDRSQMINNITALTKTANPLNPRFKPPLNGYPTARFRGLQVAKNRAPGSQQIQVIAHRLGRRHYDCTESD
ncbi:MAG TPA: hypothetical protein EYN37_07055 [Dehalococcoidia bacterium]|jgi:hypothetical protein|nr:hypothetical protein [Dehalococcoidia bacterium]